MKAVRIHNYGGPEVLVYEEAPMPAISDEEVLIKVFAAGVNPVDWKIREGLRKTVFPSSLPLTMGWDVSGVIEETGAKVTKFKKGDEVYSNPALTRNGTYAEYVAVQASQVAFKPRTIDHIMAAAVPLAGLTAWQAIFDAGHLQEGQRILIIGASGGVGTFAVQFAKWKKAYVIGVGSTKNIDFLRALGVDQVIDYKTSHYEKMVSDVDLVFDAIGGESKSLGWKVLKPGGAFVSITGKPDVNDPDAAGKTGIGILIEHNADELSLITDMIEQGAVKPIVSTVLPLSNAYEAQNLLQKGQNIRGKIVLKVV